MRKYESIYVLGPETTDSADFSHSIKTESLLSQVLYQLFSFNWHKKLAFCMVILTIIPSFVDAQCSYYTSLCSQGQNTIFSCYCASACTCKQANNCCANQNSNLANQYGGSGANCNFYVSSCGSGGGGVAPTQAPPTPVPTPAPIVVQTTPQYDFEWVYTECTGCFGCSPNPCPNNALCKTAGLVINAGSGAGGQASCATRHSCANGGSLCSYDIDKCCPSKTNCCGSICIPDSAQCCDRWSGIYCASDRICSADRKSCLIPTPTPAPTSAPTAVPTASQYVLSVSETKSDCTYSPSPGVVALCNSCNPNQCPSGTNCTVDASSGGRIMCVSAVSPALCGNTEGFCTHPNDTQKYCCPSTYKCCGPICISATAKCCDTELGTYCAAEDSCSTTQGSSPSASSSSTGSGLGIGGTMAAVCASIGVVSLFVLIRKCASKNSEEDTSGGVLNVPMVNNPL